MTEEKYPEHYFEHYIACAGTSHVSLDQEGFRELAQTYLHIEGIEALRELVQEIHAIAENNDWSFFADHSTPIVEPPMKIAQLKLLAQEAIALAASQE
ncbi:hypothetical protein BBD42_28555 [Paenibacillus sp. BIHB 4019]|uniref:CdiI immunity protein domain-containing protein n=1 Tax=Paenibacillus sp. BIHB 4019 TaxID=1870819 RepID=A0A1B2DQM3_9BACL|nr:hypothetical protein [Paenibacillus sp. BIHB 4019]ANY70012.1 hypothetical protein BBD42_28555 [Paenibacillus sp. BIHB 4019]